MGEGCGLVQEDVRVARGEFSCLNCRGVELAWRVVAEKWNDPKGISHADFVIESF